MIQRLAALMAESDCRRHQHKSSLPEVESAEWDAQFRVGIAAYLTIS